MTAACSSPSVLANSRDMAKWWAPGTRISVIASPAPRQAAAKLADWRLNSSSSGSP
jgi:hypothetical protein